MSDIKCKDYHIIRVSYMYTVYNLAPSLKKLNNIVREYNDFRIKFINKFSGYNYEYWEKNYAMDTLDCAYEYICEKYKMFVQEIFRDGVVYMIPKDNVEMIEWINLNLISPHKILKRCPLGYHNGVWSRYKRDMSAKHTEKLRTKFPNIYNSLIK